MNLADFGNIPFRISALESLFPGNADIVGKAMRMQRDGEIVRLKKGMYVASPRVSGKRVNDFLVANHLHGPSYVSMQSALRFYGLIPESVYATTSVALGLAKKFTNNIGEFVYLHSPQEYYPIGITDAEDEGVTFLIATPEKALCDLMIFTPRLNLRYLAELRRWLEEDLRFDMDALETFDLDIIRACRDNGRKKTMLTNLIKIIEYGRNV